MLNLEYIRNADIEELCAISHFTKGGRSKWK